MKRDFVEYIYSNNLPGSNKASSYLKALEYLEHVLNGVRHFEKFRNIFRIDSVPEIIKLYHFILEQQRLGNEGIFNEDFKKSYWQYGFYSAAINSYKQFLIIYHHERKLNQIIADKPNADPKELGRLLDKQKIDNIEDFDLEPECFEGKDRTQEVKSRVNQNFFRRMILSNYKRQCCINGLDIAELLRASHIMAWSKDKGNRLNPANGLCLSATYDAAFDLHLISLDDDYRLVLGSSLKEHATNQAYQEYFKKFEGKRILLPHKNPPDKDFLEKHRNKLK
jgi:putative restriction endonuclease